MAAINFMISTEEFELLLSRNESSTLDFKKEFYHFDKDKILATSQIVKDVISFSNTIRTSTSYIIFGVKELENKKELFGIDSSIDDASIQEKLKDKTYPRPKFQSYFITYNGKKFLIFEFPIQKYDMPITPAIKMKGLKLGQVYYRNGSANTEANSLEVINISDWFRNLPEKVKIQNDKPEQQSKLLIDLTHKDKSLSAIFSEIIKYADRFDIKKLKEFCVSQLSALPGQNKNAHLYRSLKVFISEKELEINQNPFLNISTGIVRKELRDDKNFHEVDFFFHYPIMKIENLIDWKNEKGTRLITITSSNKQLNLGEGDYEVFIYIFETDLIDLYNRLRQKVIDLLMKN